VPVYSAVLYCSISDTGVSEWLTVRYGIVSFAEVSVYCTTR
jgi:hypothetical protein